MAPPPLDVVTYVNKGDRLGLEKLEKHGGENWRVVAKVVGQIGEGKEVVVWFGSGAHKLLAGLAVERAREVVDYDVEPFSLGDISDLDLIVGDDVDLADLMGQIVDMGDCRLLTPKADGVSRDRLELRLANGLVVEVSQVENVKGQMRTVMLTNQGVGLVPVWEGGRVAGAVVLDETDYLADNPAPFRVTALNPDWEGSVKWGDLKMATKAVEWMVGKGGSVASTDWLTIGQKLIDGVKTGRVGEGEMSYIRQKMAELILETYGRDRFLFWQAMVFKIPAIAFFSPTMAEGFMAHPEWQGGILSKLLADTISGSKIEIEPQTIWEKVIGLMMAEIRGTIDGKMVKNELAKNWPGNYPVDWDKISFEDDR